MIYVHFLDTKYHVFYIWHMNVTCHPWTPAFVARHSTEVHWATKSSNVAALEAMTRGNRGLLSTVTHCMFKKRGGKSCLVNVYLVGGDWTILDHDFKSFSVYWEFHNPNWLSSNIFQRGRSTTNQQRVCETGKSPFLRGTPSKIHGPPKPHSSVKLLESSQ